MTPAERVCPVCGRGEVELVTYAPDPQDDDDEPVTGGRSVSHLDCVRRLFPFAQGALNAGVDWRQRAEQAELDIAKLEGEVEQLKTDSRNFWKLENSRLMAERDRLKEELGDIKEFGLDVYRKRAEQAEDEVRRLGGRRCATCRHADNDVLASELPDYVHCELLHSAWHKTAYCSHYEEAHRDGA